MGTCGNPTTFDGGGSGGGGGSPTAGAVQDAAGIVLSTVNDTLELVDTAAANVTWTASFIDLATSSGTDGSSQGTIAAATTTIVAAPAASISREIFELSIRNTDTVSHSVTIQKDVSGTNYTIRSVTIGAGETYYYTKGRGWYLLDTEGRESTDSVGVALTPNQMMPVWYASANNSSSRAVTVGGGAVLAAYIGRTTQRVLSVIAEYNIITAAVGVTWAEVAVATGSPTPGANPTLTVRGFTNVAATIVGTGVMRTTITLAAGQTIQRGMDLWILVGAVVVTTVPTVRAQSYDDQLQMCMSASAAAAARPSLIVGVATAFTTDTTEQPPYFAAQV